MFYRARQLSPTSWPTQEAGVFHAEKRRGSLQGWQRRVAMSSHHSFRHNHGDPASQALLDSEFGPHASREFTTIPFGRDTTYQPHIFRMLLLRRLRFALPVWVRCCRCRGILDPLGDHRSVCAHAGVLQFRCVPPEVAHDDAKIFDQWTSETKSHAFPPIT